MIRYIRQVESSKNMTCARSDDKILVLPKSKALNFADDKLNVNQNTEVVLHRIENIEGKEENAGYQYFLLFPQCFQKTFFSSVSKVVIVW